MKSKTFLNLLLVISAISLISPTYGQVTIGSNIEPNSGALLDIKSNGNSEANATGGINIPRVNITNFTPTTDTEFAASIGGTGSWDRTKHKGLTVYHVDTTNPSNEGLYTWTSTKWEKLGGLEPWLVSGTTNKAVSNTENIYQMGQVTIGSNAAVDATAVLNVVATDKGVLLPRVTLTANNDQTTIPNPSNGLLVYNTGLHPNMPNVGYVFWNAASQTWRSFASIPAIAPNCTIACNQAQMDPEQKISSGVPIITGTVMKVPYTLGNGGAYNNVDLVCTTNPAIIAKLRPGALEIGSGVLSFTLEGIPTTTEEAPTGLQFDLSPFYTANPSITPGCSDVAVGTEVTAEVKTIATMGVLEKTTENGVTGYGRTLTTPDRKFSIRIFVPTGINMANANLQIRNNQTNEVDIIWSSAYAWTDGSSGATQNSLKLPYNMWCGNNGDNGANTVTISSSSNAAWGNEYVYYLSRPEQRSYMWTRKDSSDKTFYHMFFMMGASDTGTANDARAAATKAFIKIDQIKAVY